MQPAGPDPDPSSPAPPAPLPPPLPVPAQPVPLAYAGHATVPDRPARLRVLAVTSIVFASLSILTNLFGVGFYTFLIIAEQPGSPRAAALAAPAPARPYTGDPVGPEGMPKARRDEIVEALRTRQRLPGDHAEMLRRLLAEAGTRVFPDGTDPTSSVSHVSPDPGRSAESRLSFTTPTGRVELTSTTATFTPRQSARNRAAAGARRGAANGDNRAVKVLHNVVLDGSETQPRWSAIALGEMLDRLHQQSNGRLTALQAAVLKAEAESSDAPPLPRSWDERPDARVGSFPQDGVILYDSRELAPGRVWLLPDGRRVRQADAPHGVDPATGAARERPSPTPKPEYRYFPGSRASFALLAVDALLEVGLSIYLFAAAAVLVGSAEDGAQRHAR